MVDYEGFSNFDTWEAYNILLEDEMIYQELLLVASESSRLYFKTMVCETIERYYHKNRFDASLRVKIDLIQFKELRRAFIHRD